MLLMASLGINLVVLVTVFGLYSKLDEISRALRAPAPPDKTEPETPLERP